MAPLSMFLSRVLTNAPPLPGLTCWKYRIVNRLPSTLMAVPFLNWLVDIMLGSSPSRRLIFAALLRGVDPAQTPRYYRTVSLPVSPAPLLSCVNVGEMNLHRRYIQDFQSVVQSVRIVGPCTGVYDEPVRARRFPRKTDHLAF